jgi:hypothetical protein
MTETRTADVTTSCSFCCKASTEVGTIVAGPGVHICDECVALCAEIIATKPEAVEPMPTWEAADLDTVLATLPRVVAAGTQVEDTLTRLVGHARTMGATWARIGEALGTTRQAAWDRFSGEE